MKEMSSVKTSATTESAGQFYTEDRLSNRKNLNFISSYLRGIFFSDRSHSETGRLAALQENAPHALETVQAAELLFTTLEEKLDVYLPAGVRIVFVCTASSDTATPAPPRSEPAVAEPSVKTMTPLQWKCLGCCQEFLRTTQCARTARLP